MLLVGILFPTGSAAQEPSGSWRDFDCVRESEAWLSGYNASGLIRLSDSVQKIAIAEILANKSDGQFANYSGSDNSFTFGAQTESFFRLSEQVVFYGKVDYRNFTGKNMAGSAFIYPDDNAFDIVEPTASNSGRKNREQYLLIGGLGVRLAPRLSLGGKIDYLTANYAKQKDLRHKNTMLDLTATLGAAWQLSKTLELGANYIYRRSVESIEFERLGATDRLYSPLISYGVFYGRTELFGGSGYTQNKVPLFNQYNGGALQVNLNITQHLRFFNEFSFLSRNGYYGSPTTAITKICYAEHDGRVMAYSGKLSLEKNQNLHLLKINFSNEQLTNYENNYEIDTQGSITTVIYRDPSRVLDKSRTKAGLEYTARLNVEDYCPAWILKAGGNFANRQQTVSLFPFFREQDIYWWDAYVAADKRITSGKNQYGISLTVLYGAGGGEVNNDGTISKPSEGTRTPYSSDYNLFREYEYLTSGRITGNIGATYSRMLNPKLRAYIRLEYELTKAFQIEHLEGDQFNFINLAIGCNF